MTRRLARWLWRAIAVAAVLLPLPPLDIWSGAPAKSPLWWPHVVSWAIGLAVVGTIGVLIGRLATRLPRVAIWPRISDRLLVGGAVVFVTGAAALISRVVFAANPHLVDEMAQLVHARAFAAGRLAAPAPQPADAFLITHTWITAAGWISQYPPGQTVLFALGFLANAVEWVNPLLGGLSGIAVYWAARGLYGRRVARAATVLWALSAWVLFMSASYMNHVGAMALGIAACALVMAPKRLSATSAVVAGIALGATAATRPMDAAGFGAVILTWLALAGRVRAVGWLALGVGAVALPWGWSNWALHGHPLRLGYTVLYEAEHGLGFHQDPWGQPYTPFIALSNAAIAVRRLHLYLYEWPIPALLPLAIWAAAGRQRARKDLVLALGILAVPALYFFYWHSGFFLGPRFYFVIAPFLVIATARFWCWAWSRARCGPRGVVRWDWALGGAAGAVILWGALGVFPQRARYYHEDLPTFKLHPERELRDRGVRRALVLVATSWGDRIVVDLWGLGAKPGLVERAYRRVDACVLDRLRRRAREQGWGPQRVTAELLRAVNAARVPAPFVAGWPDPTLRLVPGRALLPHCEMEMRRDLEGFTLYGNLAWRNAVARDRGLVFARDLYERNAETFAQYAGWELWRYAPPAGEPNAMPVLTRVGTVPGRGR